jgi:Ser/Thr protein kinase RdoA (MazF antagonist)
MTRAEEAAARWGGTITRLIEQRENAVFEIALPTARAALRLHRAGYQTPAAIQSELWWCAALAGQGVSVPAALPALSGALLVTLQDGTHASVVAWVEGVRLGESGIPFAAPPDRLAELHRSLGRLLASVHSVTDQLTLPATFTRPRWDIPGLVGDTPLWGRFWDHPVATTDQRKTLRRARDFLHDHLTARQQTLSFGPIHADVLRENVFVQGDHLSLIDFDDCGFGFRLYDLGTALLQSLAEPHYEIIRDALLAGYAETRPCDSETVELFILARCCASVGWTMPRRAPDDPINLSHLARATQWAETLMDR